MLLISLLGVYRCHYIEIDLLLRDLLTTIISSICIQDPVQLPGLLTVAMVATVLDLLQTVSVSQTVNSLGTVAMISELSAVS